MIVFAFPGGKSPELRPQSIKVKAGTTARLRAVPAAGLTRASRRRTLAPLHVQCRDLFAAEAAVVESLPVFPLGTVLFPGMVLPLHIFEDRYRRLMRDRQGAEPIFGVALTSRGQEVGDEAEIHRVGTAASLVGAGRYPDGRWDVVVQGGRRFRSEEHTSELQSLRQ